MSRSRTWPLPLVVWAIALGGCAETDRYVWADQLPPVQAPADHPYQIVPGDLLSIRVWNQESLNTRTRVRDDGRISILFLNDVLAAGRAPNALAAELQTRLKDFIVSPVVTVSVEEPRLSSVSVLGEVTHPGVYPIDSGAGVLHALAAAGGLNEYARPDRIFVLRQGSGVERIRFTYQGLSRAQKEAAAFRLKSGDVVVVE